MKKNFHGSTWWKRWTTDNLKSESYQMEPMTKWADFYRIQRIFTVSKMTIAHWAKISHRGQDRSIPPSYRIWIFLRFSSEIIKILYLEIAQNSAKNARSRWSCGVKKTLIWSFDVLEHVLWSYQWSRAIGRVSTRSRKIFKILYG